MKPDLSSLSPAERELLERRLLARRRPAPTRIPTAPTAASFPLSPAQERLWFLEQLEPGSGAYHIFRAYQLRGPLNVPSLRAAFDALLARHPILRTTYHSADGVPRQQVAPALPAGFEVAASSDPDPLLLAHALRPFQLDRESSLRALLVQVEPGLHILALTAHHIAADGHTWDLLCRDLSLAYSGQALIPPDPPLAYHDYAAWMAARVHAGEFAPHLEFWTRTLSAIEPISFPGSRAQASGGGRVHAPLSCSAAVLDFARQAAVSPFVPLMAAWQALLARIAGHLQFGVAVPSFGRPLPDLDAVAGCFVNTIVFRAALDGDPSFHELCRRLQAASAAALEHDETPFDLVVRSLNLPRDRDTLPLAQVFFNYQAAARFERLLALPGLEVSSHPLSLPSARAPLTLSVEQTGQNLSAWLEFSTRFLDQAEARHLLSAYAHLLSAAVSDPAASVARLPLAPPAAASSWIAAGQGPGLPSAETALALFDRHASVQPHAPAVSCGDECLSYSQLRDLSLSYAAGLRARGIRPGQTIGVLLHRSPRLPAAVLALWRVGAAYLPLDPAYPEARLAFMLDDAGASAVVTESDLAAHPALAARPVLTLASLHGSPSPDEPAPLACVLYTSGSTGRPKGVELTHSGLASFLANCRQAYPSGPGLTTVGVSSFSFDAALFDLCFPLSSGARLLLSTAAESRDGHAIAALLARSGPATMFATPVTWSMLLEAGWPGSPSLTAITGGEVLTPQLAAALLPRTAALFNIYGPTETTVWVTSHRVAPGDDPIPLGRPLGANSVHVLDPSLQPLPPGIPGEICIGGPGVSLGYRNQPALTAARFLPDPFLPGGRLYRTGDFGRRRSGGAIEFLGRRDGQVKLRGHRIELDEIEAALAAHPAVTQAAAIVRGQGPAARLLVYAAARHVSPDQLRAHLAERLPLWMVPASVTLLDSLPLTPTGKIDRLALPEPGPVSGSAAATLPEDTSTIRLARLWRSILGGPPPTLDANFFDSGGHSLAATRLMAAIRRDFGVELPVAAVFDAPTLGRLANLVRQGGFPSHRCLTLQPEGRRPALFSCSGGPRMRPLLRRLAPVQPVLAPVLPSLGNLSLSSQAAALAAHAVKVIRAAQPVGPYFLCGWCIGGVQAFEIARRLEDEGQTVALVALFDSASPTLWRQQGRLWTALYQYRRAAYHAHALAAQPLSHWPAYLNQRLDALRSAATWAWLRASRALSRSSSSAAPLSPNATAELHLRAFLALQPRPVRAPVLLFRRTAGFRIPVSDPSLGWAPFAPNLTVIPVPGDHESILEEPNVETIARAILDHTAISEPPA